MTEQDLERARALLLEALVLLGGPPVAQQAVAAPTPAPRKAPTDMDDSEAKKTKFPFGKHKGETLWEIAQENRDYLEWAVENLENIRPSFKAAIEKVLELTEDGDFGGNGEINLR